MGRWKLIDGPEEGTLELYDLKVDPLEKNNLASQEGERVVKLQELIERWREKHEKGGKLAPISEEDRARLRAMGYVE